MSAPAELYDIIAIWHGRMGPAMRRVWGGAFVWVAVVALFVARRGTPATRALAIGLLASHCVIQFGHWWWTRRRLRSVKSETVRIVRKQEANLAMQLGRALDLAEHSQSASPRFSEELVKLHLARTIAKVPLTSIDERAAGRAARFRMLASVMLMVGCATIALFGLKLLEGFDVLLARGQRAPVTMNLVELDLVTVQPPAYLHESATQIDFEGSTAQPEGSILVVRGTPSHAGRLLVLTDGTREVPFASDALGGVAARFALEKSARLRVAARFGQVLIEQATTLSVEAIVDRPPEVVLDGAPRHVALGELGEVELHFSARDDHGIRQIDLVLRSGLREERRTLVRLDGETRSHAGAYVVGASDAFVVSSFGAVDVLVAARDDNNLARASFGQSAVVTLDQPSLGHVQLQRYRLLAGLRRRLVDWLAATSPDSPSHGELARAVVDTRGAFAEVAAGIEADRGLKRTLVAFLRAQQNKLPKRDASPELGRKSVEEVLLALDAATESVAHRDAEQLARRLADVAMEIEAGAKAALLNEQRDQGGSRIKLGITMLAAGAAELKQLGILGADLGEIAHAGRGRISRVFAANDFENVQRAAAFLAERLRRPTPSFMGGGRSGAQSQSSGSSARGGRPKASDADLHLDRVIAELRQLARDHAAEIAEVEQVIGDGEPASATEAQRPEVRRHADELRHLVEGLPSLGAEPGSARAAFALAKELVRGAAESLERVQLLGAYSGLQQADAALAEGALLRGSELSNPQQFGDAGLQTLRQHLVEHRDWVKRMLDRAREGTLNQSRELLQRSGARERELSDRANRLARRETKEDRVLPEDMRGDLEQASHLMRQASEMLDKGRGQVALDQQRRAQSLLEREAPESDQASKDSEEKAANEARNSAGRNADGPPSARGGKVVSTSDVESREEFRRRVQKGLSKQVPPELSPAVRRYAEGLLK